MTTKQRGGARPNSGNKAKDGATLATTDQVCVRIWKRQRKDFRALGGSEWLRRMIDAESQANAELTGRAANGREGPR